MKLKFYVVPTWCGTANTQIRDRKEVCSFLTINNRFIHHRTAFAVWHINNSRKERGYVVRLLWFGLRILLEKESADVKKRKRSSRGAS